jgi:hypothetical protein
MLEDQFADVLVKEAHRLSSIYMETLTEESAVSYVREFIQLLSPVIPERDQNNPLNVTLHALIYAKVFEECFLISYKYADKKSKAIASLKNAFKTHE